MSSVGSFAATGTAVVATLVVALVAVTPAAATVDPDRLMAEAERALASGDAAGADRLLASLLEHDPDHVEALVSRGKLHVQEGRLAAAARVYVHLAELRPGNGLYALHAGRYLEATGRFRDARPYLQRAVRQRPEDPDPGYRLGTHYFIAGKTAAAIEHLGPAAAMAPRRGDIAIKLAQALERSGETAAALAVLDGVIALRPDDALLHHVRGMIRSRGGRYSGAVEDLQVVVRDDPQAHTARYALARALLAVGREAEGTALMDRFIADDAERRRDIAARATARLAGASPDDSPLLFRRRMEDLVLADPSSADANRQLALAYAREGDDQMAELTYARAARLDPDDVASRRERGRLLLRMDRAADAVAVLTPAAALFPTDADLRSLLDDARRRAANAAAVGTP